MGESAGDLSLVYPKVDPESTGAEERGAESVKRDRLDA